MQRGRRAVRISFMDMRKTETPAHGVLAEEAATLKRWLETPDAAKKLGDRAADVTRRNLVDKIAQANERRLAGSNVTEAPPTSSEVGA